MGEQYRRILAQNVVRLRAERGLTQKRLAVSTEVSAEWVALIERGRVNPTLDVIVKLARALSVVPEALLSEPPHAP